MMTLGKSEGAQRLRFQDFDPVRHDVATGFMLDNFQVIKTCENCSVDCQERHGPHRHPQTRGEGEEEK